MTMLDKFRAAEGRSRAEANHLLLKWLSDDETRAALYKELVGQGVLQFQSRADIKERSWYDGQSTFHQEVFLLTGKTQVDAALTNKDGFFSNQPYQGLGSGNFMLGLDGAEHEKQRKFAAACLMKIELDPARLERTIQALANLAFKAAAVLPLKQRTFDLVELAEQAAARYVGFLFGFDQADQALIEESMRKAYLGLNFLILGRHFVSHPGMVDDASRAMGALLVRTAHLIDLYRAPVGREQADELRKIDDELKELREWKDRKDYQPLKQFKPVLRCMAEDEELRRLGKDYSGAELAMIVVGLIAGTIGNIQASVAIAINEFFRERERWKLVHETAGKSRLESWDYCDPGQKHTKKLQDWIWEALRLNPPAAFLPRRVLKGYEVDGVKIPAGALVILALGGATLEEGGDTFDPDSKKHDQRIFGGPPGDRYHQCIGDYLAMPAVAHFVREVALLPELAQTFDPRTGEVLRLEKLWGFNCRKYPLEYVRREFLVQSPLIVNMRVKSPVPEHAEALRKVIRYGAPRIEKKLRDSKHVHFASFVFVENDARLILYTVYDGDFDAYIEHFALDIGPLFDRIFAHIQDAPPLPVNEFPKEFVDTIRRYNMVPAAGYFFSAYRKATVSDIVNTFKETR